MKLKLALQKSKKGENNSQFKQVIHEIASTSHFVRLALLLQQFMRLVAIMFSIRVSTKMHRRFCICAQIGNAFASNTKQKY